MDDIEVEGRSWSSIAQKTMRLRQAIGLGDEANFPIASVLEDLLPVIRPGFFVDVRTKKEMGNREGLCCPQGTFIAFREDIYDGLISGCPRARFTGCHELGHLDMHTNITFSRAPRRSLAPFRSGERQADVYAATLLAPRSFLRRGDTPYTIAARHGMSFDSAERRLDEMLGVKGTPF